MIYYWRDLLEQAGVDERTAFQTPEHMEETMQRLQASGVDVVPAHGSMQVGLPVPPHGPGDVVLVVGGGVLVDLDHPDVIVVQMVGNSRCLEAVLAYAPEAAAATGPVTFEGSRRATADGS